MSLKHQWRGGRDGGYGWLLPMHIHRLKGFCWWVGLRTKKRNYTRPPRRTHSAIKHRSPFFSKVFQRCSSEPYRCFLIVRALSNFDRYESHRYLNNWINRCFHGWCIAVWPVRCLWKWLLANITRGLWLAKCPGRFVASWMNNVAKLPKMTSETLKWVKLLGTNW